MEGVPGTRPSAVGSCRQSSSMVPLVYISRLSGKRKSFTWKKRSPMFDSIAFLLFFSLISSVESDSTVKWRLNCGIPNQGQKCSYNVLKDCPGGEEFSRLGIEEMGGLRLTSVYNGSFITQPDPDRPDCVKEQRWRPGVNISWTTDETDNVRKFSVEIIYVEKRLAARSCSQCLQVNVPSSKKSKMISLVSVGLCQCKADRQPEILTVRVAPLTEDGNLRPGSRGRLEASMAFTLDSSAGIRGLPMHFNRIVPRMNEKALMDTLNPRTWITPLVVTNSSCDEKIEVKFEVIPTAEYVKKHMKYVIYLYKANTEILEQYQEISPYGKFESNQMTYKFGQFGNYTFTNVTAGHYKIHFTLSTGDERPCLTLVEPGIRAYREDPCDTEERSSCTNRVSSGWYTMNSCPPVLDAMVSTTIEPSSPVGLWAIIIVCSTLAFITTAAVTVWYFKHRPHLPPRTPASSEINDMLAKKTVFLMYCIDNQSHRDVVLRLADLLQEEGHLNVILDVWNTSFPSNMYDWVLIQQQKADVILLVGSEGASRYLQAHREYLHWPLLEEATPHSRIFPLAVKAVQQIHSMYPHGNTNKMLLVSFDYTKTVKGMVRQLELLTCNNHHYRLTKDVESLLLHIHGVAKYRPRRLVREWAKNVMATEAGNKLEEALEIAEKYHNENPSWFHTMYGDPVPVEDSYVQPQGTAQPQGTETSLDPTREIDNLWMGPASLANESERAIISKFTPPEDCTVDISNGNHSVDRIKCYANSRNMDREKSSSSKGSGQDMGLTDSGVDMILSDRSEIVTYVHVDDISDSDEVTEIMRANSSTAMDKVHGAFCPPSSLDSEESILMLPEELDAPIS